MIAKYNPSGVGIPVFFPPFTGNSKQMPRILKYIKGSNGKKTAVVVPIKV